MEHPFVTTDWAGRRAFVTGCTGFLGTWVSRELLAAGADVVGLVRDTVRDGDFVRDRLFERMSIVRGRVEDGFRLRQAFAVHEVDAVFHLAGPPADAANRSVCLALWFETVRSAVRAAAPSATLIVPVRAAGRQPADRRTVLVPIPPRCPGPVAARLLIEAATTAAARPAERSAA